MSRYLHDHIVIASGVQVTANGSSQTIGDPFKAGGYSNVVTHATQTAWTDGTFDLKLQARVNPSGGWVTIKSFSQLNGTTVDTLEEATGLGRELRSVYDAAAVTSGYTVDVVVIARNF